MWCFFLTEMNKYKKKSFLFFFSCSEINDRTKPENVLCDVFQVDIWVDLKKIKIIKYYKMLQFAN